MKKRNSNLTRLIAILLWAVLALVQIQQLVAECVTPSTECRVSDPADGCSCNQHLDRSTDECTDCRDCCLEGLIEVASCSRESDTQCCVPGKQFYNRETTSCQNCTVCSSDEKRVAECTLEADTQCQPKCQPHQYYAPDLERCIFNCKLCVHGCITSDTTRCRCQPSQCYLSHDLLCDNDQCSTDETPPVETGETSSNGTNDLPPWGIGLISIGVVIGIVAFSAGTMILGFCTQTSPPVDVESELGVNTKPPLGTRGALLNGHLVFDKGRKYGYSSSSSVWASGGSGRSNYSSRNSSRPHSLPRPENATPI